MHAGGQICCADWVYRTPSVELFQAQKSICRQARRRQPRDSDCGIGLQPLETQAELLRDSATRIFDRLQGRRASTIPARLNLHERETGDGADVFVALSQRHLVLHKSQEFPQQSLVW